MATSRTSLPPRRKWQRRPAAYLRRRRPLKWPSVDPPSSDPQGETIVETARKLLVAHASWQCFPSAPLFAEQARHRLPKPFCRAIFLVGDCGSIAAYTRANAWHKPISGCTFSRSNHRRDCQCFAGTKRTAYETYRGCVLPMRKSSVTSVVQ